MIRILFLAGLVTGMGPGLVHAQTPDAAARAPAAQHCIVYIDPVQPGAKASTVEEGGCFATWAEAVAAATDGAVRLDPQATPQELKKLKFPAAGKTPIAVDYVDADFQGIYITWFSRKGGCTPKQSFFASHMPEGWNDHVSSVIGSGNCGHQSLYEHTDFNAHKKGLVAHCRPSCEAFPTMDNKRHRGSCSAN